MASKNVLTLHSFWSYFSVMLSVIVAGLPCIFMLLALSSCNVISSLVHCNF